MQRQRAADLFEIEQPLHLSGIVWTAALRGMAYPKSFKLRQRTLRSSCCRWFSTDVCLAKGRSYRGASCGSYLRLSYLLLRSAPAHRANRKTPQTMLNAAPPVCKQIASLTAIAATNFTTDAKKPVKLCVRPQMRLS